MNYLKLFFSLFFFFIFFYLYWCLVLKLLLKIKCQTTEHVFLQIPYFLKIFHLFFVKFKQFLFMWVYSAFLPACLYIPVLRIRNISKNTVQEILIQSLQTKVCICYQEPLWYLQELPITSPSEALGCFTLL